MEELAKILRRSLRHAVDILGNGCAVLGYPHRGRSGRGRQSPAKCAGRAREDKGLNAGRCGFFKEIERARNVGIDEVLQAASDHMGFMQARRMEDRVHALHAPLHARAVHYRTNLARKV